MLDDLSLLTAKQDSIEQTKKLRKLSRQCCIDSGTVAIATRQNYQINSLTRGKLTSCIQIKADRKIFKIAKQKNDTNILAITYEELTDKEARYHASCYRVYTTPANEKLPHQPSNYNTDEGFCNVWKHFSNLFDNPEVREFIAFPDLVENCQ